MVLKKEQKKEESKKKGVIRVPSGIINLDPLIEGGFEKNSINLIVAGGGCGKTIFCIQFLLEGIKQGEKVLYITFEERKEEFYRNMYELGWDLEEYEKQNKFFFLEYTPEKVRTMVEEGGGIIESIVLQENIKRVAIDSITSFGLLFETDLEKRKSALELFNLLRKWDCTTLLTYERDPIKDTKTTSRILEFESDSIIFLYSVRGKELRERYIEIIKMRGTNHSRHIFPYEIEKGKGIVIAKQPYIGELKNLI